MAVGKLTTLTARLMLMAALLLSSISSAIAQESTVVPNNQMPQGGCGGSPSGLILYVPVDDAGEPTPGLNVADPSTGDVVASLDLPQVDRLIPLRAKGKAVASTATDEFYLVDALKATLTKLEISPDTGSLIEWTQGIPLGAGTERTLLSDGRDAFLLDAESGAVTDLRSLLPADSPPIPLLPVLSPDEESVLLWDGIRLWLLPVDQPEAIRPLTPQGVTSLGGSFSADGQTMIYHRTPADDDAMRELVVEPVDGSADTEVIARGNVFSGTFIGGTDLIAFERFVEQDDQFSARTALFNRTTGVEMILYTHEVEPTSLFPSPERTHLLALVMLRESGPRYVDINVRDGSIVELLTLDGLNIFGPTGSQWRIAMPMTGVADDSPTPGYYAIDLNTGVTTIMAPLDLENNVVASQPLFSNDGRTAMSAVFGPDGQTLWIFDLLTAKGAAVRDNTFIGAALSPDGCWFAVADKGDIDGAVPTIVVDTTALDESQSIGPGRMPVWVAA